MLKDGAQAIRDALDGIAASTGRVAVIVLRALADAWAPDGEYTADDLRAIADQLDGH